MPSFMHISQHPLARFHTIAFTTCHRFEFNRAWYLGSLLISPLNSKRSEAERLLQLRVQVRNFARTIAWIVAHVFSYHTAFNHRAPHFLPVRGLRR